MPRSSLGMPSFRPRTAGTLVSVIAVAALAGGCTGGPRGTSASSTAPATAAPAQSTGATGSITVYTTVTQSTIDAVAAGWKAANPGVTVEVFRAPTAEVAARIATDLQSGVIQADVLWLTDPLSMQGYADQSLLRAWTPPSAAAIDAAYRTPTYVGTRLLNMVLVRGTSVTPGPSDWGDLKSPDYKDAVAIPDPGFAGSALGALGYLSQAPGYGTAFYQALKDNGATQVKTPDEVTSGVAEGRFKVGMTLDTSARTAIEKGSPITVVWPSSGAITIYSPIAVVASTDAQPTADSFMDFTLSPAGQALIAAVPPGWQPVVGSGGPVPGGPQVSPDWLAIHGRQEELLAEYRAIFGG